MKKQTALFLGGLVVVILGYYLTHYAKPNVQVNNKTCPVSGQNVNHTDTYVHNGKEYRLCSDQCKESLSKNPGKYLGD